MTPTRANGLGEMLQSIEEHPDDAEAGHEVRGVAEAQGGVSSLREDCEAVSAYHGDNYLPLLWRFYKSHRPTLFQIARVLTLRSTSQDNTVMQAVDFLLDHEKSRGEWMPVPPGVSGVTAPKRRKSLLPMAVSGSEA